MSSSLDLAARQSTLIRAMRFPLMMMVLYAHSPGVFPTATVEWSFDGWNIYHFFSVLISQHLCAVSTRWFFCFSGFLFFWNMKEGAFSFQWVVNKWKKRIWTLLVPFMIWNVIALLAIIAKNEVSQLLSFGFDNGDLDTVRQGPLYWFVSGPADFPLWYLRDLILMSLAAPLLYLLIKRFRWLSLLLLIGFYYSPLESTIPGTQGIFYYSIGAWAGIQQINLIDFCKKNKIPAAIATAVLLLLATSQIGRPMYLILFRLYAPLAMITFMNIMDSVINNIKWRERLCQLSATVFFIYAAHEIYILGWTKGIFSRILGNSLAGTWISYWFVPLVVLAICLGLYYFFNHFTPKTLAFICGGRNKK